MKKYLLLLIMLLIPLLSNFEVKKSDIHHSEKKVHVVYSNVINPIQISINDSVYITNIYNDSSNTGIAELGSDKLHVLDLLILPRIVDIIGLTRWYSIDIRGKKSYNLSLVLNNTNKRSSMSINNNQIYLNQVTTKLGRT